jgi:hypothetical protein
MDAILRYTAANTSKCAQYILPVIHRKLYISSQSALACFLWSLNRTAIITPNNIQWLVLILVTEKVILCESGTESIIGLCHLDECRFRSVSGSSFLTSHLGYTNKIRLTSNIIKPINNVVSMWRITRSLRHWIALWDLGQVSGLTRIFVSGTHGLRTYLNFFNVLSALLNFLGFSYVEVIF